MDSLADVKVVRYNFVIYDIHGRPKVIKIQSNKNFSFREKKEQSRKLEL